MSYTIICAYNEIKHLCNEYSRGAQASHTHTLTHTYTHTHTLVPTSLFSRSSAALRFASAEPAAVAAALFSMGPPARHATALCSPKNRGKNSNVHRFMQAESRYNPNGPTCTSRNSIMLAKKTGKKQQRSPFYASRKQVHSSEPTCTSRNSIMLAKKQEKNSNVHRFMQADSRYNPNGPTCTSHNSIMLAKKQGEKQQRSPFYASRKQVQSQRAHLHITQQHYACHNVTKPNSTFFKAFCSFLCKQVHLESRFIHNGHGPTCTADSSNIIMCGTTTLDS